MTAYFDAPNTIRKKPKTFNTSFNGYKKEEVSAYISELADQCGIMLKLLADNGIPLNVEQSYFDEEQIKQSESDVQEYLAKFLCNTSIEEMQKEIERLSSENRTLKATSPDKAMGQLELLNKNLYEKEEIISKLRAQLESSDVAVNEDLVRKYEEEIASLKEKLSIISSEELDMVSEIEALRKEKNSLAEENSKLKAVNINESKADEHGVINFESNEEESLDEKMLALKYNIDILETEVAKLKNDNRTLEMDLEKRDNEIKKLSTFKDGENEVVINPDELVQKHKEVLEIQKNISSKQEELQSIKNEIQAREEIIERNKHLLSDEYVHSIEEKEKEVNRLQAQMNKMLVMAQTTAENTESEARLKAEEIINKAIEQKNSIEAEAMSILEEAKKRKLMTEEEMNTFREETRQRADEMVLSASQKAEEVLQKANEEAQQIHSVANEEVGRIMNEAEEKVVEINKIIETKKIEIEELDKHFIKLKNDSIIAIRKVYYKLESVIYDNDNEN